MLFDPAGRAFGSAALDGSGCAISCSSAGGLWNRPVGSANLLEGERDTAGAASFAGEPSDGSRVRPVFMANAVKKSAEAVSAKRANYALLGVFSLLVLAVGGLTFYYLNAESESIKREVRDELSIIADMKAKQICGFLEDRAGGLQVIQQIEWYVSSMQRIVAGAGTPSDKNRLTVWLEAMRKSRRYGSVTLADARGRVAALSFGHRVSAEEIADTVKLTLGHESVSLQDFHGIRLQAYPSSAWA